MNPNHKEKINSYSSVHFLSNSEFYAYLYKFGTKHEYHSLYYSNGGKMEDYDISENQTTFHTVRRCSFTWDAFACASVVFLSLSLK